MQKKAGLMKPGTNCADAPVKKGGEDTWFLNCVGEGFTVLVFGDQPGTNSVEANGIKAEVVTVGSSLEDVKGVLTERYDGAAGAVYLLRPDLEHHLRQHRMIPKHLWEIDLGNLIRHHDRYQRPPRADPTYPTSTQTTNRKGHYQLGSTIRL